MEYRVIGILTDHTATQAVIQALRHHGVTEEDLGVLYRSPQEAQEDLERGNVAAGAAGGIAAGSAVGAIAGLASLAIPGVGPIIAAGIFGSTMAGAAAGGVLGAFSQIGFSNDLAATYKEAFDKGETVFAIDTPDPDAAQAVETLLRERNVEMVNTFQV